MGEDLLDVRFERQPHMVTRRVAQEMILVPVGPRISNEPCLYTLDGVAAFLWERLEGRTGRELIQLLAAEYDPIEPQQIEQDIRNFLEELQSIDAIRTKNS